MSSATSNSDEDRKPPAVPVEQQDGGEKDVPASCGKDDVALDDCELQHADVLREQ